MVWFVTDFVSDLFIDVLNFSGIWAVIVSGFSSGSFPQEKMMASNAQNMTRLYLKL